MSCARYRGVIRLLIDPFLASTAGLFGAALKDAARDSGVAMRAATTPIPALPVVAQASQGTAPSRTSSAVPPPRPSVRASQDLPAAVIHQQNIIALQGLELQYARVLSRPRSTPGTPDTPTRTLSGILHYSTSDFPVTHFLSRSLHCRSRSLSFTGTIVILAPTPMSAFAGLTFQTDNSYSGPFRTSAPSLIHSCI